MIALNEQQQHALDAEARPLRLVDPRTNKAYILVPADVYDRLQPLLYEDGPWTEDEKLRLLAESGQHAGWDTPEMDDYDHYDEARKKLCP